MRAILLVNQCQHMSHMAQLWVSNIQNMHELDCNFICDINYMLGPVWHLEIVPDSKNNFNFERSQSRNNFWRFWGLCDTEIILQLAGQLPSSTAEHEKMLSGLKLTVWLQQPLCNAIWSYKVINMYHTYILVFFFF